ncbi:hypothetical protein [Halorussus litoreus]|uniref:hypothetical protein n=1 Tax=Halorussus litoreus TaxID=1710536 RepID=UPI000E25EC5C|nr:hypothetical protein [Halorussus litoreus]
MGERDSTATENSVAVALVRDLKDLADWLESSAVVRAYRRASAKARAAAANSALAGVFALLAAWIRHSFVYRWLTKEPDPDIVVIDLRETYTVGPFIAVLDRAAPRFERWWYDSAFNRTLDRTASALQRAPIRVLSLIVAAGVLTNLLVTALTGSLSTTAVLVRVAILAVALAGTRVRTSWGALAQARTVQLLVAALEPPEPPEQERRE